MRQKVYVYVTESMKERVTSRAEYHHVTTSAYLALFMSLVHRINVDHSLSNIASDEGGTYETGINVHLPKDVVAGFVEQASREDMKPQPYFRKLIEHAMKLDDKLRIWITQRGDSGV